MQAAIHETAERHVVAATGLRGSGYAIAADYEKRVEDAIKKAQRQASLPGFRAGKVPAGMIKKMYGKSVLADELNKILNDSINNYIVENKIEILGNPLPKADEKIDWENGKDFTITAKNLDAKNIYVKSASLNGHDFNQAWIEHEDILKGGELVLEMDAKPSAWGSQILPPVKN